MKKENTRGIREGAMMVALTVVFMLLNKYVPLFSFVGMFVCGLPMAILAARNGFKVTIPAVLAVFLVAILVDGGVISAASTVLMSVLPGAVAGYMLGQKKPFFTALFATCVATCIGWIFELAVLELVIGNGIDEILAETMRQMETVMKSAFASFGDALSDKLGMDSETFVDVMLKTMGEMFRIYIPAMVVISSMITGYVILRLSAFFIKRTKLAGVECIPFSQLKAPRSISIVAVILYIIYMFSQPMTTLWAIVANAVLILYAALAACGLSFIDFKFKNKIKSTIPRFLIYGAVLLFGGFLMGFVVNALIIIGILDSGRNFRGLK